MNTQPATNLAFFQVWRDAAAIDRRMVRLVRLQARCLRAATDALDMLLEEPTMGKMRCMCVAASGHLDRAEEISRRLDTLTSKRPVLPGAEYRRVTMPTPSPTARQEAS